MVLVCFRHTFLAPMYQVRNFQAPHLSGLENDSLGAPVPILILRYDPKDRPPPGWSEAARLDN